MFNRVRISFCVIATALLFPLGLSLRAEQQASLRGFSPAGAAEQLSWEQKFRAMPQRELLREYMAHLSSEPHHVGSPKDKANAEWILGKFRSFGLHASIEEFQVLFPTPEDRLVELILPEHYLARLQEPAVVEDPDSSDAGQLPTYNAYSADGDVTAQIVYVNYGVPEDYETLKELGVDVKGKIVLARYGGSWRGIKPKVAHENGAIGCLIYSDPKDDGYYQGAVYPEGPFRPEQGVQRGSVVDMPLFPGDPLTPGTGAVEGATRIPIQEAPTLVKIPVMPLSYGDALPLLRNLRGPVAPESWRGALPVTYRIGPGPALVHFKMKSSWQLRTIYDVIARIDGSTFPDEWIIQGNHHDAWVNGAGDPVSGMAALLEEARALGELLRQGWRPKRTIIIAAWDGEEAGLLGSTEWAEKHAAELADRAVAYINTDSNGRGWLDASGSHSLEKFVNEVARDIPDPVRDESAYQALRQRRLKQADEKEVDAIRTREDLRIGALGSGSDYTAFLDHLGIASLNLGFGGEDQSGIYHSIYDTIAFYLRFSDGDFLYGRALSQLNGTVVMRLAGATVLPFEFANLAETLGGYVNEIKKLAGGDGGPDPAPLESARQALLKSAEAFNQAFARAASSGALWNWDEGRQRELNRMLYQSERLLTSPEGLPLRPWFRHQLYAPGFYTGYGVKTLPFVREALEQKQPENASKGIEVVTRCLLALASRIDAAAKMLGS